MPGGIDYSSLVQKHMGSFYSRTNVTTTSSGYSAPSTANQIADALLGVGSMVAMMAIASKAQGGGNQVSSSMSAKTSAMAAKTKAQAIINVYTPKIAELKDKIAADANYATEKSNLETKLAELNEQAGATKNKDDVPAVAANLQSARADLSSWTQKAQEYERNEQGITSLKEEMGSTPLGKSIKYLTGDGKANTQSNLADFGYDEKNPETKSSATSAMNQFNSTAKQKENNFNTLTQNNKTIEGQAKSITTYNTKGEKETICVTPKDAPATIKEGIENLQKLTLGNSQMSPDSYLQQKAEIDAKIKDLDANHAQIERLKTTLTNYESKVEEANLTIAEADATIAEIDARAGQVDSNNAEINGLKATNKNIKKNAQAKKFLGIRVGTKYTEEQKLAREQNKHRMAELRSQNDILNS